MGGMLMLSRQRSRKADPARGAWLQRQCACGQHTGGGECDACKKKRDAFARPQKAIDVEPEDQGEQKPSPHQNEATIQCNGSGGYEILYGSYANATCGTKSCVTAHESSHIADWQAKWSKGCTGKAKGYLPKGDPPDDPLLTVAEYNAFLKTSECTAHTADLNCANALPKTGDCKETVEHYINLTATQKARWCPGG